MPYMAINLGGVALGVGIILLAVMRWTMREKHRPGAIVPFVLSLLYGMLAALAGPGLAVVTGFFPQELLSYSRAAGFAQHWLGKLFLFAAASLFAWHAVHRILCSLHDVGIHKTFRLKLACYGVAGAVTLVSAAALLSA